MKETKREAIKEEIRLYTELIKIFAAISVATAGGIVGLFLKLAEKPIVLPFILTGVWMENLFVAAGFYYYVNAKRLIGRLKDE